MYYNNIRRSGLIAVNLRDSDELISVFLTNGENDIFIATRNGISIRFKEQDVRPMGRGATGVKAINLEDDDYVIGSAVISEENKVLLVTDKGFGKCTDSDNYRTQTRGGKGLKTYKITDKTGQVRALSMVNDKEELIMVTSEGVVIRLKIKDISTVGRIAQGVKLVNLKEGVNVISIDKINEDCINEEEEKNLLGENAPENSNIENSSI